ncbi:MAG TPA: sugar transferase, partial [Candidatus Binatia bacterium]|nr:sugar transferase [Candidatus Binatia bacterium]
MLQRDRQIRTQVQQLADACLFAASFWIAYTLRSDHAFSDWISVWLGGWISFFQLERIPSDAFEKVVWLYFALVPAAPLVLESQGFYNRPVVSKREAIFWPLAKSCFIVTIGLVLLLFMFRETAPRGVMILFGVISFGLVWIKEEITTIVLRSRLARSQYKRRIILAGTPAETARLRRELSIRVGDTIEVEAEFDLANSPVQQLIEMLHEHSVSGVLISARNTTLEPVENVIKLCETEGVETWLMADFFATQ